MNDFIQIESLAPGAIYRLRARNIVFGVYLGEGRFAGIRNKFGNRFLDIEQEWTTSTHYGTARAVEQVGALDPAIPLKTNLGTQCEKCHRGMHFDEARKETPEGGWRHDEDDAPCCRIEDEGKERTAWPYSVDNKAMFAALDRYDQAWEAEANV